MELRTRHPYDCNAEISMAAFIRACHHPGVDHHVRRYAARYHARDYRKTQMGGRHNIDDEYCRLTSKASVIDADVDQKLMTTGIAICRRHHGAAKIGTRQIAMPMSVCAVYHGECQRASYASSDVAGSAVLAATYRSHVACRSRPILLMAMKFRPSNKIGARYAAQSSYQDAP